MILGLLTTTNDQFLKPKRTNPLEREESAHNVSRDTILSLPESELPETQQDPISRLADVLVNQLNKPQSMKNCPVATNSMTFDGKSENLDIFEDLFHTLIKIQPAMIWNSTIVAHC